MITTPALLTRLRELHITFTASRAGKLHVEAPSGTLTDDLRAALVEHRDALLARTRDTELPDGLKASYCPVCGGRAVVVAPAAPDLRCARCAPERQSRSSHWVPA